MFLFPFLKELLIGGNTSENNENKKHNRLFLFLKKLVIVLGCLSVALNFYLISKVYDLGRENLNLQKQIKEKIPKPMVYPNQNTPKPEIKEVENKEKPYPTDNKKPKRKLIVPPAVPVDRERFLRQLEDINKII